MNQKFSEMMSYYWDLFKEWYFIISYSSWHNKYQIWFRDGRYYNRLTGIDINEDWPQKIIESRQSYRQWVGEDQWKAEEEYWKKKLK